MHKRSEGDVIILSADDAETISRRLGELTQAVRDIFERRRQLLRSPDARRGAKILPIARRRVDIATLDELF
jgi:hypothetical protein